MFVAQIKPAGARLSCLAGGKVRKSRLELLATYESIKALDESFIFNIGNQQQWFDVQLISHLSRSPE